MIAVQHDPARGWLEARGVFDWPEWEKEVARFDRTGDDRVQCCLLKGEVTVTPGGGAPIRFGAGDFVTFPAGLRCVRDIGVPVRRHCSSG